MAENKPDDERKRTQESNNILEKLIKLDKKHSNFEIYEPKIDLRLRVKNVLPNSNSMLSQIHQEQGFRFYWKHLSNYYFRKLERPELDRLDYLQTYISQPLYDVKGYVPNFTNFEAFDYYFTDKLKTLYTDASTSQLNYENLMKQIQLSFLIGAISQKQKLPKKKLEELKKLKDKCKINKDLKKRGIKAMLQDEQQKLDEILKPEMYDNIYEEKTLDDDPVIKKLKAELKEINNQNHKYLKQLQNRVNNEVQSYKKQILPQIIYTVTDDDNEEKYNNEKNRKEIIAKLNMFHSPQYTAPQLQFVRNEIIRLDIKQVAESIVMISQVQKVNKGYEYEVLFEEALNPKNFWISESQLLNLNRELNSILEHDLFQFYNIPQKTMYSHTCHHFAGIQYIHHNRTKPNQYKKHPKMIDFIKKKINQNESFVKKEFDSCHQCQKLFHKKNLIKCNYKSSTMGLPVLNQDPVGQGIELDNMPSQSYVNRKRSNYSQFLKKSDGELVCKRKYCRTCLKQYDPLITVNFYKSDWICPFCNGACFCTRCQRLDMIQRLKSIFNHLGGDVNQVSKECLSEQYLKPTEEDRRNFRFHNDTPPKSQIQQKQENQAKLNEITKIRLREFAQLNKIRLDLEKLRLLTSQTCRREKIKMLIQQIKHKIFQEKLKTQETQHTQTKVNKLQEQKKSQELEKIRKLNNGKQLTVKQQQQQQKKQSNGNKQQNEELKEQQEQEYTDSEEYESENSEGEEQDEVEDEQNEDDENELEVQESDELENSDLEEEEQEEIDGSEVEEEGEEQDESEGDEEEGSGEESQEQEQEESDAVQQESDEQEETSNDQEEDDTSSSLKQNGSQQLAPKKRKRHIYYTGKRRKPRGSKPSQNGSISTESEKHTKIVQKAQKLNQKQKQKIKSIQSVIKQRQQLQSDQITTRPQINKSNIKNSNQSKLINGEPQNYIPKKRNSSNNNQNQNKINSSKSPNTRRKRK